ncbi:MAG: hypothetical protein WCA13_18105 [Terriglobales bacterium]
MDIAKLVLEYVKALAWPLTVIALSLSFRSEIKRLLARLRKAVLPGGVSFDLQEEVREVKELSEKVESAPTERRKKPGIPLTEANARMMKLGLAPMLSGLDIGYYRSMAETDPVLSLAGLRIDLETMMRNVAIGFKLQFAPSWPVSRVLARLREAGAITPDQMQLAQKIFSVCNQAVHGRFVSREEAEDVIKAAEVLFRQYLAWLSWGFDDDWKPSDSG